MSDSRPQWSQVLQETLINSSLPHHPSYESCVFPAPSPDAPMCPILDFPNSYLLRLNLVWKGPRRELPSNPAPSHHHPGTQHTSLSCPKGCLCIFLLNLLKTSCRDCDTSLLNSHAYITHKNKDILLHSYNTIVIQRQLPLTQYYLIYNP